MKHQGHEFRLVQQHLKNTIGLKPMVFFVYLDFDYENFPAQVDLPTQFDFVLNSIPASQKNSAAILENRFSISNHFMRI
jgi:hypothetical protein